MVALLFGAPSMGALLRVQFRRELIPANAAKRNCARAAGIRSAMLTIRVTCPSGPWFAFKVDLHNQPLFPFSACPSGLWRAGQGTALYPDFRAGHESTCLLMYAGDTVVSHAAGGWTKSLLSALINPTVVGFWSVFCLGTAAGVWLASAGFEALWGSQA